MGERETQGESIGGGPGLCVKRERPGVRGKAGQEGDGQGGIGGGGVEKRMERSRKIIRWERNRTCV